MNNILVLIDKIFIFFFLVNAIDSNYIEIEDQKCKYHKDFRLYLMTKQTNPKITTSIYSNMTVINCSITQQVNYLLYFFFFLMSVKILNDEFIGIHKLFGLSTYLI